MMCKVKDEIVVKQYRLLGLDEPVPLTSFRLYKISGQDFEPVIVYDGGNDCIAIYDTGESMLGKEVQFV